MSIARCKKPTLLREAGEGQLCQVRDCDAQSVEDEEARQVGQRDAAEPGPIAGENVPVDGDLGQPRLQQLERRDGREQQHGEQHEAAVWARDLPKPPHEAGIVSFPQCILIFRMRGPRNGPRTPPFSLLSSRFRARCFRGLWGGLSLVGHSAVPASSLASSCSICWTRQSLA